MKRKDFLQRFTAASAGLFLAKAGLSRPEPINPLLVSGPTPPYLRAGDLIGITCPASPMDAPDLQQCRNAIHRWGFRAAYGKTVNRHWQRFGGTDDERAADLQQMLDDDDIKAIIFGRGGYGVMRMMDKVNWEKFIKKPKWLVGFSDITALHCHIHSLYGIPTLHADMGNGFSDADDASALSLKRMLSGIRQTCQAGAFYLNRPGNVYGKLTGGNLSLITAMQGSKSAIDTTGKLLFIEDVSEYKYTIDRMMMNLKRSGKLDHLAGLIVGGFTATKAETEETFNMSVEEIIYEKVKEFSYPVCFHFPAGHQKINMALKLGASYHLQVNGGGATLSEGINPNASIPVPLTDSLNATDSIFTTDTLRPVMDSVMIQ